MFIVGLQIWERFASTLNWRTRKISRAWMRTTDATGGGCGLVLFDVDDPHALDWSASEVDPRRSHLSSFSLALPP